VEVTVRLNSGPKNPNARDKLKCVCLIETPCDRALDLGRRADFAMRCSCSAEKYKHGTERHRPKGQAMIPP
jgi:hypothetical protein